MLPSRWCFACASRRLACVLLQVGFGRVDERGILAELGMKCGPKECDPTRVPGHRQGVRASVARLPVVRALVRVCLSLTGSVSLEPEANLPADWRRRSQRKKQDASRPTNQQPGLQRHAGAQHRWGTRSMGVELTRGSNWFRRVFRLTVSEGDKPRSTALLGPGPRPPARRSASWPTRAAAMVAQRALPRPARRQAADRHLRRLR